MQGEDEKKINDLPDEQKSVEEGSQASDSDMDKDLDINQEDVPEEVIEDGNVPALSEPATEEKGFTVGYQKVDDFQKQAADEPLPKSQVETKLEQLRSLKPAEIFSKVAASSGNKRIQIILLGVAVVVLGYYIFNMIKEDENAKNPNLKQQQELQDKKEEVMKEAKVVAPPTPITEVKVDVPASSQKLPDLPQIVSPQPPEPPPPPTPSTPSGQIFPSAPTMNTGSPAVPALPGAPPSPLTSNDNSGFGASPSGDRSIHSVLMGKDMDDEQRKKLLERRKASSLVLGGGADKGESLMSAGKGDKDASDPKDKDKTKDKSKSFLGFGDGNFDNTTTQKTSAVQISATTVGDLSSMIVQGKIINAVLETAINTDLPGNLRAIITRDVYAENGKAVLIPKGSRVVGTYATDLKPGQNRIGIIWNRLIRPDGIDLAIQSEGTDQLGRTGVEGSLDSKFWTQMGLAVLTSYVIPVAAQKLLNVNDNSVATTTTAASAGSGGTPATTSTGTVASQQLQDSTQQFQKLATEAIKNAINVKPTVIIDQGTRINIYVNKDVVFAKDIALKGIKVVK
jgi:type IV secretion system protein VirB10